MANLVIVESPSKAGTIKGYLGSNYKVIASKGHVRDLPKSTLGVDIENDFEPHYINIRGKGDLIKEIRKEAKSATKIFLATDPDREGEAISWHLATALNLDISKTSRVAFNEITKTAVKAAIKEPSTIDMNLVNAQQTRRILDRIVGYKLSPLLWKTVKSGLSAGRVQSVATAIIVNREEEIKAFVPKEYWTIDASLLTEDQKNVSAHFYGNFKGKMKLECEEDTMNIVNAVKDKPFKVSDIKRSQKQKMPSPPFTTSTLQQEASHKLNFQSQRTMRIAQELYEGVNVGSENGGVQGLITYMRTDSLRVSSEAQTIALDMIKEKFGEKYCPVKPRIYKSRSNSQDAHEAVRPSNVLLEPSKIKSHLSPDQFKLYKLIWDRFVASQMQSATINTLTIDFDSAGYIFRTSGYTVSFAGYMAVYEATEDTKPETDEMNAVRDMRIPDLAKDEILSVKIVTPAKHFTEPPARYTEASLIKFLEEKGIGRPSTYTPIITTIIARNYVKREGKALVPTQLGFVTTELMQKNFPDIIDYKFTANMESMLDEIENGKNTMKNILSIFWADFGKELQAAEKNMEANSVEIAAEETDIICEKCGSKMVIKNGRFGKFAACPNYPTCKNTKPLVPLATDATADESKKKKEIIADFKCEKCGADMVLRTGKFGSFYACVNYPTCKFTKQRVKELDVPCPLCGSKIQVKHGKNKVIFYSCEKYPDCTFSSWDMPTAKKCPKCSGMLFRKKGKAQYVCHNEKCGYKEEIPAEELNKPKE